MSEIRYRPPDNQELPKKQFEKKVKNNPYISKIYDYPALIIPYPTPEKFNEIWNHIQKQAQMVHVEIGCGSGQYLFQMSQLFPNHSFLGIELRYKRLVSAAKKIQQGSCSNILFIKDKGEYLGEYLGEKTVDKIHVNFPDPWSKTAQKKHRLLSLDFFKNIYTILKPQGEFLFKTDHQEYFQTVNEILRTSSLFDVIEQTPDLHQSIYNESNIETEFERMFKIKDNPIIGYLKAKHCG